MSYILDIVRNLTNCLPPCQKYEYIVRNKKVLAEFILLDADPQVCSNCQTCIGVICTVNMELFLTEFG